MVNVKMNTVVVFWDEHWEFYWAAVVLFNPDQHRDSLVRSEVDWAFIEA